jgi:hypothetical protein
LRWADRAEEVWLRGRRARAAMGGCAGGSASFEDEMRDKRRERDAMAEQLVAPR